MVSAFWHSYQSFICAFLGAVLGSSVSIYSMNRRKRRSE